MLIGIRPTDESYVSHSGATFSEQDQNGNQEVAYYEINNTTDEIVFDISDKVAGLDNPVMLLHTSWGSTDYNLEDEQDNEVIIAEQSGFDTDVWIVGISGRSGRFRITEFDTSQGVTGTQAAWLPFVELLPAEV